MFKQILENKISDKFTNFNNAGKLATQWFDKFRNSLDIVDGQNNLSAHASPIHRNHLNNQNNNHNDNSNNGVQLSNSDQSLIDSSSNSTYSETNSNYYHANNNHINNTNNNVNMNMNINKKQNSISTINDFIFKSTNDDYKTSDISSSDEISIKRNSSKKEKSTSEASFSYSEITVSNIVSPKLIQKSKLLENSTKQHNRVLVRQPTDLTCQFPSKPFQKINSETVEIPGLNVKVVRYRIEDDLGKIEPHMYIKYGNSNGVDPLSTQSKGKLCFSLHYNEDIQSLSVTINRAEIYVPPYFTGSSLINNNNSSSKLEYNDNMVPIANKPDTYVKLQMLPDKKRKYQTRIQRKTCIPTFEETFYFHIPYQELATRTLNLTVLDFGRFTKHSLIGSVKMNDLQTIKDLMTKDIDFVRNLLPLAEDDLELGELTLSLCYLPAAGRLTVTIVKANNLKAMDINGKSDPYVKVTLVSKGKRIKKKKTSVMKNTLNPVYNESMIFDVLQDQIEHVDMIVKVIDYDRVGSNELIGCIGIGPSFDGIGRDHYYRMLENPRKPMTQTYYLRDSSFLRDNLPARVVKALSASEHQESIDSKNSDHS